MTTKPEGLLEEDTRIPRLQLNRAQRLYYPVNLRRVVRLVWVINLLNLILLLTIFYVFFTMPKEQYYATSFSGETTHIFPQSLEAAQSTTLQNKDDDNE